MQGLLPVALAAALGSAANGGGGSIHVPPPVSLHYELDAEELHLTVNVQEPVYETWFPSVASLIPELDDDGYARELEQARTLILDHAAVEVDGVAVLPRVVAVEYLEQLVENDYLNYVVIEVVYGVKTVPQSVLLQWDEFRTDDPTWPMMVVEATFEYETDLQLFGFAPDAPLQTWLRPDLPPIPDPSDLQVGVVPPLRVPWAPLAALGLGFAGLVAGRRGAFELRRRWPVVLGVFAAAVPLSAVPPVDWRPPWQAAFEMPDEDHARYVFEALHLNVYRAFDYETESDVYDALAQSVEAGLLDQVYDEVYRSLIIAEEGGLMSRVRGVEMLESDVTIPDPADAPRFDVACRWRVKGSIEHWGHRHLRTNEYRAQYTVRGEGSRWRLASVEVIDLGRIEDPEFPQ